MRLNEQQLFDITGQSQAAAQVRWFEKHYGVVLPSDRRGPILTQKAFEGLVSKSAGLAPASDARPQVRLTKEPA